MHGIGHASSAVTIVNALSTGIGCAAGISLIAAAEVDLEHAGPGGQIRVESGSDTPLVRSALMGALRRLEPNSDFTVSLVLRSQIPPSKGLKSSSAVSAAIIASVANALHRRLSTIEIAALSAEISQAIGLSATGAFDDALAGLQPGIVVTDNPRRSVLREAPVDDGWEVVLWIPQGTHHASTEWRDRFAARSAEGRAPADAALAGDFLNAMTRNTELVEKIMGYSYRGLREELRRRGALASGVAGLGPTLAAIVPKERSTEVLHALPAGRGDRLTVSFMPRSAS